MVEGEERGVGIPRSPLTSSGKNGSSLPSMRLAFISPSNSTRTCSSSSKPNIPHFIARFFSFRFQVSRKTVDQTAMKAAKYGIRTAFLLSPSNATSSQVMLPGIVMTVGGVGEGGLGSARGRVAGGGGGVTESKVPHPRRPQRGGT